MKRKVFFAMIVLLFGISSTCRADSVDSKVEKVRSALGLSDIPFDTLKTVLLAERNKVTNPDNLTEKATYLDVASDVIVAIEQVDKTTSSNPAATLIYTIMPWNLGLEENTIDVILKAAGWTIAAGVVNNFFLGYQAYTIVEAYEEFILNMIIIDYISVASYAPDGDPEAWEMIKICYGGGWDTETESNIKEMVKASWNIREKGEGFMEDEKRELENKIRNLVNEYNKINQYEDRILSEIYVEEGPEGHLVVISNKGDYLMKDVVLINERWTLPDEYTTSTDIFAGEMKTVQTSFTDIDLIEFNVEDYHFSFSPLHVSMIPLFTYQMQTNPSYAPQTVQFRAGPIPVSPTYQYQWTFGDGVTASSKEVGHTYNAPGNYNVTLTVTTEDSYTNSITHIVTVKNPVKATFVSSIPTGSAPLSVSFDAGSSISETGGNLSYHWDFGDNSEATGVNPVRIFNSPGTYQVKMRASLTSEIYDETIQTIIVRNPVYASFEATPSGGPATITITFDASYSRSKNGITSYQWDFGDGKGTTTTNSMVTHTYTQNALRTVKLTVKDNQGFSNTCGKDVHISSGGPTYISAQTINYNAEWTRYGSPYVIGNVTVAEGASLHIEPGVVVKFVSGYLDIKGTLIADGTPDNKVVFTSFKDDTYGGDTNNDGTATTPSKGDWSTIYFLGSSTNSSILNHCLIQYGGYGYYSGYWSILYCHNTSLTISNSEISNSSNYGIYLVSSANLNIVNNTISNNNQDGIYCASQSTPKISGNTITNNFNGIVCEQSNPVFVKDNTFTNNKNYAVYMSSSISTFTGNKGAGNTYNGIGISGTLPTNATALFHLILVI